MLSLPGIKDIEYLTKGKRGLVYTGIYKNKKVAIKIKHPESKADGRIKNEGVWLKKLNKYKIGPKLLKSTSDYLVCEFIEGDTFVLCLEKGKLSKKGILQVIESVLEQCFILDKLKVDKKEMHHPVKHIIVNPKLKPVMIDFERCHIVDIAKNVTQFVDFLMRFNLLLSKYDILVDKDKII